MEQIKYDIENDEFFVEKSSGYGNDEKFEKLPLSSWGLQKQFTVYVHVSRKIQTEEYENPVKVLNYKIPITYTIQNIESGKTVYLKMVQQGFDTPQRDNPKSAWVSLMLRDVNTGVTQFSPMPNSLYKGEFPFLATEVGKAIELHTKQDILALWRSGLCLGFYDAKIENFIV
jgi:hypothetical protein